MLNSSSVAWSCKTLDSWNNSRAWIWWLQRQKLQDKSDQDGTHNYKNQKTCKGHPNHSRRLHKNRCQRPTDSRTNSVNWQTTLQNYISMNNPEKQWLMEVVWRRVPPPVSHNSHNHWVHIKWQQLNSTEQQ